MLPALTRRRGLTALVGLAGLVGIAGVSAVVLMGSGEDSPGGGRRALVAARTPVVLPVLHVAGLSAGRLSWSGPVALTVADGVLRSVRVLDPQGSPLAGNLAGNPAGGAWTSTARLLPDTAYRVLAMATDRAGSVHELPLPVRTTLPTHVLHARSTPRSGAVVGVGLPVVVTLDRRVVGPADRTAVEKALVVTTVPPVRGAWRWISPSELHYRGPHFWTPGTTLGVRTDLTGLALSGGTWGAAGRSTTYAVGASMVSTVDVTAHVMRVVRNGRLLRTVKVSTGRDKYPTKGGVHLVVEKTALKVMDSATVGIPRKSPDGYFEKVPFSVRISYGGAFVHSADWSVRDQGVRNVSHGCVNLSPSDAQWFFGLTRRGDVVDVVHAAVGPLLSDPGMADWNIPFAQWAS